MTLKIFHKLIIGVVVVNVYFAAFNTHANDSVIYPDTVDNSVYITKNSDIHSSVCKEVIEDFNEIKHILKNSDFNSEIITIPIKPEHLPYEIKLNLEKNSKLSGIFEASKLISSWQGSLLFDKKSINDLNSYLIEYNIR